MDALKETRFILDSALHLNGDAATFTRDTPLFGALPELDSIGVVSVISLIEQRHHVSVGFDEIDAATFQTVGTLSDFIAMKIGLHLPDRQPGRKDSPQESELSSPAKLGSCFGISSFAALELDSLHVAGARILDNWSSILVRVAEAI